MGFGTRQPTDNEPEKLKENKWGTDDNVFALLSSTAVRCCHCQKVVASKHLTTVGDHVFCPDCKDDHDCLCNNKCAYNIGLYRDAKANRNLGRSSYGASGDAGEAD